eukprot:3823995-Amphidinium_carterae.1
MLHIVSVRIVEHLCAASQHHQAMLAWGCIKHTENLRFYSDSEARLTVEDIYVKGAKERNLALMQMLLLVWIRGWGVLRVLFVTLPECPRASGRDILQEGSEQVTLYGNAPVIGRIVTVHWSHHKHRVWLACRVHSKLVESRHTQV